MTSSRCRRWWTARPATPHGDSGVALATVMIVMMVLTAIGATVALVGINNMKNASRDRQAGASLGAGDAGVAMAIEYIRSNGVGQLNCMESNQGSCTTTQGWNSPTNPRQIPLDNAGTGCTTKTNCAYVWIGVVQQYAPPAAKFGIYNIHSEGVFGPGPSARRIVSTVKVAPDKFPIGVFGQTLSGNGGTQVSTESLFTTNCVYPIFTGSGNGTRFVGIDQYWGQPAAAHTTSHISSPNSCSSPYIQSGSAGDTSASDSHCATPNGTALWPSTASMDVHQSQNGGLVGPSSGQGAGCYHVYQRADGSWYPDAVCPSGVTSPYGNGLCDSTAFTTADLQRYGYRPRGLSSQQYAALEDRAKAIGTYNIPVGSVSAQITAALNAGINDPVVYWDCSQSSSNCGSGPLVSLSYSNFPANTFAYPPQTGSCPNPYPIVTVVVEHGNLTFQGGNSKWFDGAFFVPDGSFNGNGGYNIVGTLFSQNLDLGGNQQWALDSCWVNNFPGAVVQVTQSGFREDDATDVP